MITQLRFQNFKALKNAELKLGAFNVIVGPNGSGKSSVLQGLEGLGEPYKIDYNKNVTVSTSPNEIKIVAVFDNSESGGMTIDSANNRAFVMGNPVAPVLVPESIYWDTLNRQSKGLDFNQARAAAINQYNFDIQKNAGNPSNVAITNSKLNKRFQGFKIFSFETTALAQPVSSGYITELNREGRNLAGALTHLHDKDEDAYNQLRAEFQRWIPQYDGIGFDTDQSGTRSIALRQKKTRQRIPASHLSEGTLLALALLTIVHQSTPPALVGLEEPDRGLHPRLLRELRDALYRLSFQSYLSVRRRAEKPAARFSRIGATLPATIETSFRACSAKNCRWRSRSGD
jgi:predicted ATPase